jgi:hypothetical protein
MSTLRREAEKSSEEKRRREASHLVGTDEQASELRTSSFDARNFAEVTGLPGFQKSWRRRQSAATQHVAAKKRSRSKLQVG